MSVVGDDLILEHRKIDFLLRRLVLSAEKLIFFDVGDFRMISWRKLILFNQVQIVSNQADRGFELLHRFFLGCAIEYIDLLPVKYWFNV